MKHIPYDPVKSFLPIIELAIATPALTVHVSIPSATTKDFIAYAKARPGVLNYGSSGIGTPHHLAMELFKLATGADLAHVPFKDSGGLIAALLGGHVSVAFLPINIALPLPHDTVRILAVAAKKRVAAAPDVPTLAEEGVAGIEAEIRIGLLAPAGTSRDVIDAYNADLNDILRTSTIVEKLARLGLTAVGGNI